MSREKGQGSVYQRAGSPYWWLRLSIDGNAQALSSKVKVVDPSGQGKDHAAAQKKLERWKFQIDRGEAVGPGWAKTRFDDLHGILVKRLELDLLTGKCRATTVRRANNALDRLREFFAGEKASRITGARIEDYQRYRLAAGASKGTLAVEALAYLRRAFRLAHRDGKVAAVPHIEIADPDNAHQGYVERHQLNAVLLRLLPEHSRAPVLVGYLTGWRVLSEIVTLQTQDVDLKACTLRLRSEHSKNRDPRIRPLSGELMDVISAQVEANKAWAQRTGRIVPWLFHGPEGRPIVRLAQHWRRACARAGHPGLLLHDLRRSFVMRLDRAGVPRTVAMKLTGHKTEAVYRRYRIVADADVRAAVLSLEHFEATSEGHQNADKTLTARVAEAEKA